MSNKLQRKVTQEMSEQLFIKLKKGIDAAGITDIRQAFKSFDTNKDGVISVSEFKKAFIAMNLKNYSDDDVESIIAFIDKDGSGMVDLEEFRKALKLEFSDR